MLRKFYTIPMFRLGENREFVHLYTEQVAAVQPGLSGPFEDV